MSRISLLLGLCLNLITGLTANPLYIDHGDPSPNCVDPPKIGPCRAYFERYYYNATTGGCVRFIYGGCDANGNNYINQKSCQRQCVCSLPADPGPCYAMMPMFFYNTTSGRCEQFIYGGCSGNRNRFHTKRKCNKICKAPLVKFDYE